jgi:hypothetical protein
MNKKNPKIRGTCGRTSPLFSVTITKTSNNQRVYRWRGTDFSVDASDPDDVVTKVEFYADGVLL